MPTMESRPGGIVKERNSPRVGRGVGQGHKSLASRSFGLREVGSGDQGRAAQGSVTWEQLATSS